MPLYKYIAAKPGMPPEQVVVDGDNEKESLAKLRRQGLIPVRFLGVDDAGNKRMWRKGKPDIFEFTRQLSPLYQLTFSWSRLWRSSVRGPVRMFRKIL
jgi:type II secretory pathway component PulF